MQHPPSLRPALFAGRKAEGGVEYRTDGICGEVGNRTGVI